MAEVAAGADRTSGPTQLELWVSQPSDFGVLQAVLHDARRLSIAGELLMVPTLPELAALVSGEGALLGVPLALPALRADGSEVAITLILTRHAARAGRHVYLGVLEPRVEAASD